MGTINDKVFGLMEYKHRWIKNETIKFFGKNNSVVVAAKAYKEKPITDEQRNAYIKFKSEINELSEKAKPEVVKYLTNIAKVQITTEKELNDILSLKTILFTQDGELIFLFDSTIDEENGIGLQLYPAIQVGPQDIFL